MKRILIDPNQCQGTSECAAIAPYLIEFDETGVAHTVGDDIVDDDVAVKLVNTCPSMAITATDP